MKADKIIGAVQGVTEKWSKQRKREERDASAKANRRDAMTRRRHVSIKDAAWEYMEEAYLKVSANGTLPANARQIMYAARGHIQSRTGRSLDDKYFTKNLLPSYIEEHRVDWDVVFDARGQLREPHTGLVVPLGTLGVRNYLRRIEKHEIGDIDLNIREKRYPTLGPKNAYSGILFIEKEGFYPLFEAVRLFERHDLAPMSTKGTSVIAARELIDKLAGYYNIPVLVLHDFDKDGFSIIGTLKGDTTRYSFSNEIEVIDLGLRLKDVKAEKLVSEEVYSSDSADARRRNLRKNGATDEEIEFLLKERVELNAFPSDQFIDWIERKLKEHGISKVVPDDETLADAYHRMRRQAVVQEQIDKALKELGEEEDGAVPDDLRTRIEAKLKANPEKRWDDVLRDVVADKAEAGT